MNLDPTPAWTRPLAPPTPNTHDLPRYPTGPVSAPTQEQITQLREALAGGAVKHDGGKARYDLLPPELLEAVSRVLMFGAEKYAERNWEKGMKWGRVFGATMRHLWAWWRGEKADPETGFSHLWHAGCCIAFLIAYEQRNVGEDDRYAPVQKEAGAPAAPA